MSWPVEYTDEFGGWWESLGAEKQDDVAAIVAVLEQRGPPFAVSLFFGGHGLTAWAPA
jgi:hypothetical protein